MKSNCVKFLTVLSVALLLAACGSSSKPEADTDRDTIPDARDNCIQVANPDQLNTDGDSAGDVCDDLPEDPSDTKDFDGDLIGDTADTDDDNDKTLDVDDAFPYDATEQVDSDGDGIGDNADLDPTNAELGSMQLDKLIANGRVTKFIGGFEPEIPAPLGERVELIGDVNGDGLDDLMITVRRAKINGVVTGMAYLLFGQENGWPATVDLGDLSNIPHVIFKGVDSETSHAEMGAEMTPMGDIDGDGIDDFMMSASLLHNESIDLLYSGAVFLIFGRSSWIQDAGEDHIIDVVQLANYSVKFRSTLDGGVLGHTLKNIGDLNNDGLPDVVISENIKGKYKAPNVGRLHLMFNMGRYTQANISEVYDIENIVNTDDTLNRVVLEGETNYFGEHVTGMGDFNQDGYDDVIILDGFSDKDPDTIVHGSLYILFGKSASTAWPDTWNLDDMVTGEGFIFSNIGDIHASQLGHDFKTFDLNGDTIPDILASQTSQESTAQSTLSLQHVLWGGDRTWPISIESGNIPAELGVTMVSEEEQTGLGMQLEVMPDSNSNGYPELLIVQNQYGFNERHEVFKLDAALIEDGLSIGDSMVAQGDAERITMAESSEDFFMHVLGDVNGDGLSEFTLSASEMSSNGLEENGEFYLVYGYDQLYPQAFKVSDDSE